jgi:hypothetical protein
MKKSITTALTAAVALAAAGAAQAQEVFLRCVHDREPDGPGAIYAFSESRQLIWEYNRNSGQLMSLCDNSYVDRRNRDSDNENWRYTNASCRVGSNYIEVMETQVSTPRNTSYSSPHTSRFFGLHIVRGTGRYAHSIGLEATNLYGRDGQCTRIADPRSSAPAF